MRCGLIARGSFAASVVLSYRRRRCAC